MTEERELGPAGQQYRVLVPGHKRHERHADPTMSKAGSAFRETLTEVSPVKQMPSGLQITPRAAPVV